MRKRLTKCSRILDYGAVPCALSGGRLPEAFFLVFRLESQGAKVKDARVNLVDLVKSFQTSYLLAKFSVDTAENGPPKVCKTIIQQSEKR